MSKNHLSSACGLLYGLDIHHLDHLAPLCSTLGIPLIFTDLQVKSICDQTYPNTNTAHININNLAENLTSTKDVVFSCLPQQLLAPIFSFAEHNLRKKILFSWLPHGNSDKDSLGALSEESYLLIYGNQMRDTLAKKEIFKSVHHKTTIGNFRKLYYLKYKKELDENVASHISFKTNSSKTLFYAPTWGEPHLSENTFLLLSNLPDQYNIIVKFHPNTLNSGFAFALKEAFGHKSNIQFIDEVSPIHPILNQCDGYIGDHSSIAYDFLSFDKPLYFFTKEKTPIHHTGKVVVPKEIYTELEKKVDLYKEARKTLCDYAFEPTPSLENLPQIINESIAHYFATEPHVPG